MSAVIFIMGVAGSGKTTIGKLLSQKTGVPFFDGDDFHSPANREKMKAGKPLNDKDREQWLYQLNALAIDQSKLKGAIIGCSALKEKYRTVLASGIQQPIWIFLNGTYNIVKERMEKRKHFMPVKLLRSQFDDLEIPSAAYMMDIKKEPGKIVEAIAAYVNNREQP